MSARESRRRSRRRRPSRPPPPPLPNPRGNSHSSTRCSSSSSSWSSKGSEITQPRLLSLVWCVLSWFFVLFLQDSGYGGVRLASRSAALVLAQVDPLPSAPPISTELPLPSSDPSVVLPAPESGVGGGGGGGGIAGGAVGVKQGIGVNVGFGFSSSPLSVGEVVRLVQSSKVNSVKVFSHHAEFLEAMAGTDIDVAAGIPIGEIPSLASDYEAARSYIAKNIVPFIPRVKIGSIAVGNEVSGEYLTPLVPAMKNVHAALVSFGLEKTIMLTSPLNMNILVASYPPSEGRFQDELLPMMRQMMQFLNETGSHLTVNVYPFFPCYLDTSIPLSLPLFRGEEGYYDGNFHYTNMMDAMVDAVVCAMEKEGFPNLPLVIGEVGWPTGGDAIATVENARVFNNYLVGHVLSGRGSPRRPGWMQMYLFELLDEDLKSTEIGPFEPHWGLHMMNGTPKYEIDLTTGWSPDLAKTEKWCVASASLDPAAAKQAIDWACGQPSMDCAPIHAEGSACRVGDDASRDDAAWRQMAGYAINLYYQSKAQAPDACSFRNMFQVTTTDPSTATCKHPGRPGSVVIPQRNETTGRGEGPPPPAGGARLDGVGGRRGGAGTAPRTGAGLSGGDIDGHGSSWCVAAPGASTPALQNGLDWACGPGRVACDPIRVGGDCFLPNTVRDHASYAYNTYYQRENKESQACSFGGTAVVVHEDPSNGNCIYPGLVVVSNGQTSAVKTSVISMSPCQLLSLGLLWKVGVVSTVASLLLVFTQRS